MTRPAHADSFPFAKMAALLAKLKGRFILSLNDVDEVRRAFAGLQIEQVETTYTVQDKSSGKKAGEIIISGPPTS